MRGTLAVGLLVAICLLLAVPAQTETGRPWSPRSLALPV